MKFDVHEVSTAFASMIKTSLTTLAPVTSPHRRNVATTLVLSMAGMRTRQTSIGGRLRIMRSKNIVGTDWPMKT